MEYMIEASFPWHYSASWTGEADNVEQACARALRSMEDEGRFSASDDVGPTVIFTARQGQDEVEIPARYAGAPDALEAAGRLVERHAATCEANGVWAAKVASPLRGECYELRLGSLQASSETRDEALSALRYELAAALVKSLF